MKTKKLKQQIEYLQNASNRHEAVLGEYQDRIKKLEDAFMNAMDLLTDELKNQGNQIIKELAKLYYATNKTN